MRITILLAVAALAVAAGKDPPRGEASNKVLKIEATAWLDKESIDLAVGEEMVEGVVVVEVKLTPGADQAVDVSLDDFLLRSDKDGQRTTPYSPSQVAGNSVLVISSRSSGAGIAAENRGPTWGGIGGPPRRLPGQGVSAGSAPGAAEAVAAVESNDNPATRDNPLLAALKAKVLTEKETKEPLAGQLYFLLEGKHKARQIELIYKSSAGPLSVRFKE